MDWRASIQNTLRSTDATLQRLQRVSTHNPSDPSPHYRPSAAAAPSAGTGAGAAYHPAPHFSQPQHVDPHLSSSSLSSTLRALGAELELERAVREDSVREISRRTQHEIGELREIVRQLRTEQSEMKIAHEQQLSLLLSQRNQAAGGLSPSRELFTEGGARSSSHASALLPRVSELEAQVSRLQNALDDRHRRLDVALSERVSHAVAAEVERIRTVAREAARESTEDFVKLRMEGLQLMFSSQLQSVAAVYDKATASSMASESAVKSLRDDTNKRLHALSERVESAMEGKERWMSLSSEVHDLVRSQLDVERQRMEETVRLLRADVAAASKKQSSEAVEVQHALQHYVSQRMESLSSQCLTRDEGNRLTTTLQQQLDNEVGAVRKSAALQKQLYDDMRAEFLRQQQQLETRISENKVGLEEITFAKQSDAQQLQRMRLEFDEMRNRLRGAAESSEQAASTASEAKLAVDSAKDQLSSALRDQKASMDHLVVQHEVLQSKLNDLNATVSKHTAAHSRAEQAVSSHHADIETLRVRVEDLQTTTKELRDHSRKFVTRDAIEEGVKEAVARAADQTALTVKMELQDAGKRTQGDIQRQVAQAISALEKDGLVKHSELEEAVNHAMDQHSEAQAAASSEALSSGLKRAVEQCKSHTAVQLQQANVEWKRDVLSECEQSVLQAQGKLERTLLDKIQRVEQLLADQQRDARGSIERQQEQSRLWTRTLVDDTAETLRASLEESKAEVIRQLERSSTKANAEMERHGKIVDALREDMIERFTVLATVGASATPTAPATQTLVSPQTASAELQRHRQITDAAILSLRDELHGDLQEVRDEVTRSMDEIDQRFRKKLQEVAQPEPVSAHNIRVTLRDLEEGVSALSRKVADLPNRDGVDDIVVSTLRRVIAGTTQEGTLLRSLMVAVAQEECSAVRNTVFSRLDMEMQKLDNAVQLVQQQQQQATSPNRTREMMTSGSNNNSSNGAVITQDMMQLIQAEVNLAVERVSNEMHESTFESLQSLDEKINALAEAFSRQMDDQVHTQQLSLATCVTKLQLYNPAVDTTGFTHFGDIVSYLYQRLDEVDKALRTVSENILDTVDLVQRHEVGFASMNELIQAIVFVSRNTVVLATAVGLDHQAFTLRLNYPELGVVRSLDGEEVVS